jgi:hypothetical protein
MCHKKAQEAQAILLIDLCLLCFFVAMNGTFEAKLSVEEGDSKLVMLRVISWCLKGAEGAWLKMCSLRLTAVTAANR